jgi:UDP-3-O-[3-hydroxymyristoyl] N-acetylglucosamine deacetylase
MGATPPSPRSGLLTIAQRGAEARLDELRPVRTDRGVTVATADGRVRVDLIEHLLAAVGGLGVVEHLWVEVEGDEVPLLDGGALRFAEALMQLELQRAPGVRSLRVARAAVIEHERSVYRFAPGSLPSVRVEVDFPPPVGRQRAAWGGGAAEFVEHVAPARTFGWVRELEALREAGRAAAVDLGSVLVFDERGPIAGCRPPGPSEPARHKLLDLIGDLALHGGPPLGLVDAGAPGHTATHAVVARALAGGVLVTIPATPRS